MKSILVIDGQGGLLGKQVETAVKKMLRQSKYPGMKVLQFAFDTDEENDYLLHNFTKNSVAYTGTHDNETITLMFFEEDKDLILFNVSSSRFWE